jgi:HSP20 family protein
MSAIIRLKANNNDEWSSPRSIQRLFDETFTPLSEINNWAETLLPGWTNRFLGDNLAVDLYEKDDALVVKASLPGTDIKDIDIVEQDGMLTIKAQNNTEFENDRYGWRIKERRYGVWQRTIQLPQAVESNKAKAVMNDGILTISLPLVEPSKKVSNRIKVNLPKLKLPEIGKKEKNIKISHNS